MSTSVIFWGIFLGALGMAYMSYGKKQSKTLASLGGLTLIVLPYFTENNYLLVLGSVLIVGSVYFFNV